LCTLKELCNGNIVTTYVRTFVYVRFVDSTSKGRMHTNASKSVYEMVHRCVL